MSAGIGKRVNFAMKYGIAFLNTAIVTSCNDFPVVDQYAADRDSAFLTQWKLSELAGVNLHTIQQYEGRSKDINKAAGTTFRSLAQVLSCPIEDILES